MARNSVWWNRKWDQMLCGQDMLPKISKNIGHNRIYSSVELNQGLGPRCPELISLSGSPLCPCVDFLLRQAPLSHRIKYGGQQLRLIFCSPRARAQISSNPSEVLSLNIWVWFINLQFGKPDATQTGRQITLTLDSQGVSLAVLRFLWHECKKEFLLGGNPRAWF